MAEIGKLIHILENPQGLIINPIMYVIIVFYGKVMLNLGTIFLGKKQLIS
jgi:hypothetical protein